MDNERGRDVIQAVERARSHRVNWEDQWTEIAELTLPDYSDLFINRGHISRGQKKTQKLFDATAPIALTKFASVIESVLTPRNGKWHVLRPSERELMRDKRTAEWFDAATDILFRQRYAATANYASQQHETYMSLGAFGTGIKFIDSLAMPGRRGLRYRSIHLGQIFIEENHQGVIDTVFRVFMMNARQIAQQFGGKVPREVREEAEKGGKREFEIYHCVKPRQDYDGKRKDSKGKPIESLYVLRDTGDILQEGGYNTMPYIVSRYMTIPGEVYGRSPAMTVLPFIKTVNQQKKTLLKQGQRAVDPVLLAADDGVLDSFSLKPGALNYGGVSRDGRRLIDVLPSGNLAAGFELVKEEREAINDAFMVTLFQILIETPRMTATEVIERAKEKAALIAPTMGRLQAEDLSRSIDREVDILQDLGMLPPPTDAMIEANATYKVEYDSPLTRMQKAEETSGALRMFEYASQIAVNTQDPSSLDWFNIDSMIPDLAENQAMPARWMRSPQEVGQIREGRQQQQAAQQMMQAAPGMAALAKATQG